METINRIDKIHKRQMRKRTNSYDVMTWQTICLKVATITNILIRHRMRLVLADIGGGSIPLTPRIQNSRDVEINMTNC